MTVDDETVRRVARLARIKVAEEEIPSLQKELNAILVFIEQLDAIDITGVEPMTSVLPMRARLRPDIVLEGTQAELITQNAPLQEDHYFLVPKVVE